MALERSLRIRGRRLQPLSILIITVLGKEGGDGTRKRKKGVKKKKKKKKEVVQEEEEEEEMEAFRHANSEYG